MIAYKIKKEHGNLLKYIKIIQKIICTINLVKLMQVKLSCTL